MDAAADRGAFAEAVVFLSYFDDLPDPRQRGKVVYPLDEVLLLALLAVLAGAETFVDIARFGAKKLALLRRFRRRDGFVGCLHALGHGRGSGHLGHGRPRAGARHHRLVARSWQKSSCTRPIRLRPPPDKSSHGRQSAHSDGTGKTLKGAGLRRWRPERAASLSGFVFLSG